MPEPISHDAAMRAVCSNCARTWRATPLPARDPILYCWHREIAARQLPDGRWLTLDGVTRTDAQALRTAAQGVRVRR
jgi:acyl-CoA reductase-like NAD-dependent aldehyde dehydrogenase